MRTLLTSGFISAVILSALAGEAAVGETNSVNSPKSQYWELSGNIQVQHSYNPGIEGDSILTASGFRIRRARLKIGARLTEQISSLFQIEIRDNSPSLKDAEIKLRLFDDLHIRAGQFRVPVWREELRSSSDLLLVERSPVAEFLAEYRLSSRQIGLQFGGRINNKTSFSLNYSNGSGEGTREDAGRTKTMEVNNGKMFSGRINMLISDNASIGISGSLNQYPRLNGDEIGSNYCNIYAVAPDFGIYNFRGLDVEGGIVFGTFSGDTDQSAEGRNFILSDISARWKSRLGREHANLAGIDAWGIAAGISYIEPDSRADNDETVYLRFGPAVYFGSGRTLQLNGEIEQPVESSADGNFIIRTQLTVCY